MDRESELSNIRYELKLDDAKSQKQITMLIAQSKIIDINYSHVNGLRHFATGFAAV